MLLYVAQIEKKNTQREFIQAISSPKKIKRERAKWGKSNPLITILPAAEDHWKPQRAAYSDIKINPLIIS